MELAPLTTAFDIYIEYAVITGEKTISIDAQSMFPAYFNTDKIIGIGL